MLQAFCMLSSTLSFVEGHNLFPVVVPTRSAAGLDATHVVRLAQLRGNPDRSTNNRLRNLPRHDSTGLVGVGSGDVASAWPSAKVTSLSDALELLGSVRLPRRCMRGWVGGRAVG